CALGSEHARLQITYLFSFNDPAPTSIYTLSLHDALPIFFHVRVERDVGAHRGVVFLQRRKRGLLVGVVELRDELFERIAGHLRQDRKSTRLNSSHLGISYAVFCLKKKTKRISHNRSTFP